MNYSTTSIIISIALCSQIAHTQTTENGAQTTEKRALAQLAFLVGDWIGTSSSFKSGKTNTVVVREEVSYELDQELIVLRVKSPSIKLHTIIQYSQKDNCYYYHPFSQRGSGKYKGDFIDDKFIVHFDKKRRLVFEKTSKNGFREYGETLKDGHWVKYFEDNLLPISDFAVSGTKP